jgi:segregation and condensation protein B
MSPSKSQKRPARSEAPAEGAESAESPQAEAAEEPSAESPEAGGAERGGEIAEAEAATPSAAEPVKTPHVRDLADAKAIVECLLFAAVEPLTLHQIREIVRPIKERDLRALLVELQNEYDGRGGGLQIVEVAGGYQMATRGRYAEWLAPFRKRKRRTGLSVAMLETLAIIAYKQPIIRAEVDAIRGVDSSGTIHALQELELIETVGQKQVPGRPFLYSTTKDFLKHFGLKSLSDLPSIESLRERFGMDQG